MKQITQLQEWITEDKKTIRRPNAKVLKTIETTKLTDQVVLTIVKIANGDQPITNVAGSLGQQVLQGLEDLTQPEKNLNRARVECGLQLVRILIDKEVFELYRSKEDKHQYMVALKNDSFADEIIAHLSVEGIHQPSQPCYNRPLLRTSFADETAGDLVRKINYSNVKEYKYSKMPIAYGVVNKQQQIPYRVNTQLLSIFNAIQDDDLFTNKHKELTSEQRLGLTRDNSMVLDIAKSIGDREFYVYHYYDFRGRLYAAINYFSFIGSKLAKSLYYFDNAKPLGTEGWNWLLLQAANTFGYDKAPIDDRISFAENNLDKWMIWAEDPITHREWSTSDDPYSFMAAILEISKAIKSGDPTGFISGLPCALDATMSGLQILSVLSKDEVSGELCNLTGDELGDYYLYIADAIWEDNDLPEVFKGLYDKRRKIVKRSCMTYFYSCGKTTMGKHIYNDHAPDIHGLSKEDCSTLGIMIFEACKRKMTGPSGLMKLFIDAGLSQASKKKDLKLYMPYNQFPMIQCYRGHNTDRIEFNVGGKILKLRYISERNTFVNTRDVVTGSSPNVVHALDAQIPQWIISNTDYDVMTIHDSFSVVPADAGKLFEDLRTGFVELFDCEILEDLLSQIDKEDLIEDITIGNLDVTDALDNEFIFS